LSLLWDLQPGRVVQRYTPNDLSDVARPMSRMVIERHNGLFVTQLKLDRNGAFQILTSVSKATHATAGDYLDNAWVSSSGVLILTHGYFLIDKEIKKDAVKSLETSYDLLKWSSMLLRLCNDLGTSSAEIESGKTATTISCYMHENDVSEEVARGYVKLLIDEAWSKLTKARVAYSSEFKDPFFDMAINLARASHCAYQYGDGHGAPDDRVKDLVMSVLIDPITHLDFKE
nr:(E)-beta-ocimene synthase, chloroplastic-like [Tanacetum cinerariifolium]